MGVCVDQRAEENNSVDVWAENWPAMIAFLALATQWRVALGVGGMIWLGLDYPGVDVVMRRLGTPDSAFADIQSMEAAALPVLNGGGG